MVFSRRTESFILAGFLAFAGPAGAASPGDAVPGRFYCCTDQNGKYVCGDILPQVCYGRAYRELGANGRTIREVAAPLTAEQRAERVAAEEKRRKEAVIAAEQQRQDEILLATYASIEDIEVTRERSLDDVRRVIRNAEERISEIKALRKQFEDEAEFYKNRDLPAAVEKELADTEFEIKAQEAIIEARKKDLDSLQNKYDEDRKRFLELQRRRIKPR
jgi:valyl-tRNA synthetase